MRPPVPTPSPKSDAIHDAAFRCFATYGYRRTTMDDIARQAGMSRSALYLHYRNKEDIFRSIALRTFDQALEDVAQALAVPALTAEAALLAAFHAKDGAVMEVVLTTPHGAELLDAGFEVAADIVRDGEARIAALLADWLAARGIPDGLGTPDSIAAAILQSLKAVKTECRTLERYRAGQEQLSRLFGRALGP